jgi:hypothetical protein
MVAIGAMLVAVLLLIIAMIVWQESKRRPSYDPLEYVVEDAVRSSDVRRILQWEVFYLQGLAQKNRKNPVETVAGGHEASIEYIATQIQAKHGVAYSQDDIAEILRLEADYLMAIGAVGEPVDMGEEE